MLGEHKHVLWKYKHSTRGGDMGNTEIIVRSQSNSTLLFLVDSPGTRPIILPYIQAELKRRNICAEHGGRSLTACDHS